MGRAKEISCILFHFYIKPQLGCGLCGKEKGCILFHFYIKPQLKLQQQSQQFVVSYSISTSNHNKSVVNALLTAVVSYSISTSNHNYRKLVEDTNRLYLIPFLHQTTTLVIFGVLPLLLYLIPFLHQTTTSGAFSFLHLLLYLIPFLHQTTTETIATNKVIGCILFHFYIKPQH